jgi:HSP20 family protein
MKRDYTIWDEMRKMQEQMDNMFDSFFARDREHLMLDDFNNRNLINSELTNYREPVCDMYENDKEIITEIELPGINKKDIKINVSEDSVEIKTETKKEDKVEDKKKGMYRLERSYSGFYRKFALPKNVDNNKAEAEYKDGILKIKIPKLKIEDKKKKLLEIK